MWQKIGRTSQLFLWKNGSNQGGLNLNIAHTKLVIISPYLIFFHYAIRHEAAIKNQYMEHC